MRGLERPPRAPTSPRRRSDLELAAYSRRKRREGRHHTQVVVAIANKLLRRLYAVLKREAAGDRSGYRFRDEDGREITAADSSRLTRARHPSLKASSLKASKTKEGPGLRGEG